MTHHVEDDLIQRALINLLMPVTAMPASSAPRSIIRKKKFRMTRRPPAEAMTTIAAEPPPARIVFLEHQSSKSLIVCWSDACTGHYADQGWGIGLARVDAICVLTGLRIRRGDAVFRPRAYEAYLPSNGSRMILASVIPPYRGPGEHESIDNAHETDADIPLE
jgi:hypothetical protein